MAPRVDFASEEFFRDPAAVVARLRATGPVVAAKFPIVGRVWVTTTHEATARVLKDTATFSLRKDDGAQFSAWARARAQFTGAIGFLRMIGTIRKMRRYMAERLQVARKEGGEGLIAELVRVEMEGGRISGDEMVSMLFLLLAAGSDTTTPLISGSVYELLKAPGRRDWPAQ